MRGWLPLVAFLLVLPPHASVIAEGIAGAAVARIEPPVAVRKPAKRVTHGIERIDDYAWLRDENWRDVVKDPSRLAPDIRAYIDAENNYAEALMAPLSGLRARLLEEMKGRIEPTDSGVPLPDGPFAYWSKFNPGDEHPVLVRAPRAGGPEEIIVDGPALASGSKYFSLGDYHHSPDHSLYAYLVDETGAENFTLRIRDIGARRELKDVITEVASFTWANSETLFYVRRDEDHRPRFIYRHRVGSDPATDVLVYEEKDFAFDGAVSRTRTGRFVVISLTSIDTSEEWLIDATMPSQPPVVVTKRQPNLRYFVDDWGDDLVVRTNADGAEDFKLMTAPASAPGRENWRELVPGRPGRQFRAHMAFSGYLLSQESHDGIPRLMVYRRSDGSAREIGFSEEAYVLGLGEAYEFDTRNARFEYSSPATPKQLFEYNMETGERRLLKEQKVPSGHDPSAHVVRRLFATSADNEQIPITVLHRKGLQLDGSAPLFLEGYGAYSFVFNSRFDSNVLSLVDRGIVYAIAHVRGGLEKGQRWADAGRRENKLNSFRDFIAVAEHLIKTGYTKSGRIVARGDSAGSLLMGVVNNMRPDLFAGIIARVPFVDSLNTMLDETLPLTVSDFPEWGDPIRDITAYRLIASYSPYDNVKAQAYPNILVTAGISDPRVTYWEPAKWVAKLRAMKTNDPKIALITRMSAGHFGAAGRFEGLEEVALIQAFAIDVTGAPRHDDAHPNVAPAPNLIIHNRTPAVPSSSGGLPQMPAPHRIPMQR